MRKKKGVLIPRIAMQCHVYKSTCYQVCQRQSSAVNIRYPIQVHQPAELWAASLEHSRTQRRKQDRCSSSPRKHTCNAVTFRGLAQTQPHSTSHTPHSDCSLILCEIPFRAILSWFLGASIALLTPLPTTSLGPAVGQQKIKGQSAHLQPGLPSN